MRGKLIRSCIASCFASPRWGRSTEGNMMRFRVLGVALTSALLAISLALIGQPALASTQSIAGVASTQGSLSALAYRPFTDANFRYNLIQRTGYNPANCDAHHTMPQKFAVQFGRAGIQIHDPIYGLWWISTPGVAGNHSGLAAKYNQDWQTFFNVNPSATSSQILAKRAQLVQLYQPYYRC
jgi:hypothetical protein